MHGERGMIGAFSLHLARTPAEIAEARRFRDEVYRCRLGLDPASWQQEDERDRAGYVFLLTEHGEFVGTGRATPTSSPLAEIRELGYLPAHLDGATDVCEVGRMATRRRSDGISVSFVILCLGAQWLLEHTGLRRYVAYTRVARVPQFQQVGASDLGIRFQIPDRGEAEYAVMIGDIADAAAVVDRLGAKAG
jgi:hypothetical protein